MEPANIHANNYTICTTSNSIPKHYATLVHSRCANGLGALHIGHRWRAFNRQPLYISSPEFRTTIAAHLSRTSAHGTDATTLWYNQSLPLLAAASVLDLYPDASSTCIAHFCANRAAARSCSFRNSTTKENNKNEAWCVASLSLRLLSDPFFICRTWSQRRAVVAGRVAELIIKSDGEIHCTTKGVQGDIARGRETAQETTEVRCFCYITLFNSLCACRLIKNREY